MPKKAEQKQPKRAAAKRSAAPAKKVKKEKKEKTVKAAPQKHSAPKQSSEKGGKKGILFALLALLTLGAVYAALCASVNPEQVLPKTRIIYQSPQISDEASLETSEQMLELSGLNREGAVSTLNEDFHSRYDGRNLTIKAAGTNYILPVGSTLSLDTEALADFAMAPSRVPFIQRGLSRIRSLVSWRNLIAQPQVGNEELLRASIQSSGLLDFDTTVQTTFEVKDKQLVLHKGKSGQSVDVDALVEQITQAVSGGDFDSVIDSAMLDRQVNAMDWEAVAKQVCREPKNAELELERDRRKYQIVDSVTGVDFDRNAAQQALENTPEGADVAVALKYQAPQITTKRMKNKLFKHKLGTYTTLVSGTANRLANVRLAAEKCDGIILCKGDEFSYNDTLGQRTEANGFKTAGAYLNGETVQELGGGICQISSTMYAAALNANMKIVERHNHTFASSYIGLGLDATVSWGGPDFRIENDKDYPIKIEASYWNGEATVTIWGTRTDKTSVEIVSETEETIDYPTIYREDSDMYEGETRVSQRGSDGYRVQTYRKIYNDGKLVSKEKEAYSVYKPHEQIVYEGTKVKEPEPEPEESDQSAAVANGTQNQNKQTPQSDAQAAANAKQTAAAAASQKKTN